MYTNLKKLSFQYDSMKRLVIIFLSILVGAYLVILVNKEPNKNELALKPWHKLSYAGSIGTGKDKVESGIASFKKNFQKLDGLSLYWYNLGSGGGISRDDSVSNEVEKDILAFAMQNGKQIFVGIGDHEEASKVDDLLDDKNDQKDHIAKIISLITEKGYDGVIIDYENLRDDQEESFTKYIRILSAEVRSKKKILGVSIPVETQGKVFHGINIVNVSQFVDRVHMNVYEQHDQETGPGPIASIDWVNTIIKNAVDQGVESNKIVLGTAHSGHDWIVESDVRLVNDMSTAETLDVFLKTKATMIWDKKKQANYFQYKDDQGKKHVVWLENAQSFKVKIELAKSYQLQGVFIWYLGGEDRKIWESF